MVPFQALETVAHDVAAVCPAKRSPQGGNMVTAQAWSDHAGWIADILDVLGPSVEQDRSPTAGD